MASGSDEKISGTKITPLDSEVKYGVEHDISNRGAVGSDTNIDKSRANPVGGSGHYQNPAPHADSQGSVGLDKNIQQSKIEPLAGQAGSKIGTAGDGTGLRDEYVDTARINPVGEVREEMKPGS